MIPNDFIDDLLSKVDVVDVIDSFVPLKKSGTNYVACCPFHQEKTPSFTVSAEKQFYHCFGCGAHGSALGFLMAHQGLPFVDAVESLAARVGMSVPQREAKAGQKPRQRPQPVLEETLAQAAAFYQQQLAASEQARRYLRERGVQDDMLAKYGIGYAPRNRTSLSAIGPYPHQRLLDSGLVLVKDEQHYDRFRDRIMFPIRRVSGQVVGFGGRVLGEGTPKYLNSPQSVVFDKSCHVYGLFEAKEAIRAVDRVLVVEGYMDVVMLAQNGIGYAVASLGTSVTAQQIRMLLRHSKNVYFCFDGDEAGRQAAWRALRHTLAQLQDDTAVQFLFLSDQHDPDSFVRTHGAAAFEDSLMHRSLPLSAYFWQVLTQELDLSRQEDKAKLLKRSTALLEQVQAPMMAYLLRKQLGELVGIDNRDLAVLLGGSQQPAPRPAAARVIETPRHMLGGLPCLSLAQRQIISLLLHPHWAQDLDLPDDVDVDGDVACLWALVEQIQLLSYRPTMGQLAEIMPPQPYGRRLQGLFQIAMRHADTAPPESEEERLAFHEGMGRLMAKLKKRPLGARVNAARVRVDERDRGAAGLPAVHPGH